MQYSPSEIDQHPLSGHTQYFTRPPITVKQTGVDFHGIHRTVEIYDFLGETKHYSASFGSQWSKYRNVQIDRLNGTRASYKHLLMFCQGDVSFLEGATCLEIGSGAGRFTDYLVDLCGSVVTVDSSHAVYSNAALGAENLIACRADLFDIPIVRKRVDIVFCRGVIQHTENPKRAIKKLFDYVKPGGWVLFDVYPLKWYTPFVTKYWLRPFTRNLESEKLMARIEKWMPMLLRLKNHVINRILPKNKLGEFISNQLVPIVDSTHSAELHSWAHKIQWSILDTVDMYTPYYDRPMTFKSTLRVLHGVGASHITADRSSFCFKAVAP